MKKIIVLYLLTGIIQKPEIGQYWSTDPIIRTPFFNEVMARNCFQPVLEFLHFNNNSGYQPHDPQRDRLYKIRSVVENLVNKFKAVYKPEKHVSTDEELLLWKGRFGFKQYIPNKRARFAIKMFSLCQVSGYLCNSFVYLGKNYNPTEDEMNYER